MLNLKKLTLGVALGAMLSIVLPEVALSQALYQTGSQNGQSPLFVPGDAIVAGPALPTVTFNGLITNTVNGSNTTSILSIVQPGTSAPTQLPVGMVLTGSGVTTGTTVVYWFPGTNNYIVVGPSNTVAAVGSIATPLAFTGTPSFTPNWQDTLQKTAPTYASGGCTTTAAFTTNADGTITSPFHWTLKQGASGCSTNSTITLTFPAAATTWMCGPITDVTTPARLIVSTGAASTTAVVLTDYSAAGAAETMLANDVYTGSCAPH